ncbi:hypothetical protein [Gemmatimonas sp.]|uniref:hypothetical protein n=1 Tax=Gemmatimonas sp. TaxID=1962908 RepID=UPI0039833F13
MTFRVSAIALNVALAALSPAMLAAQNTLATRGGEVRQIVTFLFQPGRAGEATTIFEQQLKPIYTGVAPLRRFRAYREAESPEPLDLVVVSSYDGMAGMDAANEALRRPTASGQSAFALYGTLSSMTQTHHDQFVEMLPALSDSISEGVDLTVFEYVRVAPGMQTRFSTLLFTSIRPYERARALYAWSETGRMLVSDGWDFVRIYGIRSLADWQRYRERIRNAPHGAELDGMIAARKTLILRRDARMSVR